jgi:hypothetical protein
VPSFSQSSAIKAQLLAMVLRRFLLRVIVGNGARMIKFAQSVHLLFLQLHVGNGAKFFNFSYHFF